MVILGGVKVGERHHLSSDGAAKYTRFAELVDVREGTLFLCIARIENDGTVLRSNVGSLAVYLGGIGRDGEENAQELGESDLGGIESDLHRLGMPRFTAAHDSILCRLRFASRITRDHILHAFDVLEDAIHAPETSSRQHGNFLGGS